MAYSIAPRVNSLLTGPLLRKYVQHPCSRYLWIAGSSTGSGQTTLSYQQRINTAKMPQRPRSANPMAAKAKPSFDPKIRAPRRPI
jgi:hypothetical protein